MEETKGNQQLPFCKAKERSEYVGPPPPGIFTPVWAGGPAVVISVIMYETHILKFISTHGFCMEMDGCGALPCQMPARGLPQAL